MEQPKQSPLVSSIYLMIAHLLIVVLNYWVTNNYLNWLCWTHKLSDQL